MFKKFLFPILFVSILVLPFIEGASAYSDSIDHYSFDLPSEWEEIPKSEIDKYMDEVVRQTDGKRIEFASGFHLVGSEYFKYPYILVQEHKANTPSFSQLEKIFNNNFQEKFDRKTPEYSELLKNATAGKPFVDKERNIIFMNIQLDTVGAVQVNGLMAMFLGKKGITQMNFYSLQNDQSKWLPVFNSIIDSFKYDDGFAYNPEEAKKSDSSSVFEGVVEKGIGGAIVGGFLMLFIGLIGMLFRKIKKGDNKIIKDTGSIKYCKECGNQINVSAMICNKCGKEIIKE